MLKKPEQYRMSPDYTTLKHPEAREQRKQLSLEERWDLCLYVLKNGGSKKDIRRFANELAEKQKVRFWNKLEEDTLSSPMFVVAPNVFRKGVIQRRYDEFFRKRRAMYYLAHTSAHLPAIDVISSLNNADRELAKMWIDDDASGEIRTNINTQMLSARAAEKATMQFYRELGFKVDDTAIEQYWGGSEDYLTHDLLLDQETPIDVKNTRSRWSRNGRPDSTTYVEHIVPRFKQSRKLAHVRIVGVFSPKLDIKAFKRPRYRADGEFVILGETDFPTMQKLIDRFQEDTLSVKLSGKIPVSRGSTKWRTVLPAWLFNYPAKFRDDLYKQLGFQRIRSLDDSQIPTPQMLRQIGEGVPLAVLLAAQRDLPHHWEDVIPIWQQEFFRELLDHREQLSMPILFLSVLRHFTRMLTEPLPDYDPGCYEQMLLLRLPRAIAFDMESDISAGLLDPLRMIRGLCDNLKIIWQKRRQIQLWQFDQFQYHGNGFLRGRKKANRKLVTLMAYCGGNVGRKDKQVKCGKALILGEPGVSVCSKCLTLICPDCNYCHCKSSWS